jgi:hypothetical protein
MRVHSLLVVVAALGLAGCQSFAQVCRDAAGGPGWESTRPPAWGAAKLEEAGWPRSAKTY